MARVEIGNVFGWFLEVPHAIPSRKGRGVLSLILEASERTLLFAARHGAAWRRSGVLSC
jgi:hypothetical protein